MSESDPTRRQGVCASFDLAKYEYVLEDVHKVLCTVGGSCGTGQATAAPHQRIWQNVHRYPSWLNGTRIVSRFWSRAANDLTHSCLAMSVLLHDLKSVMTAASRI